MRETACNWVRRNRERLDTREEEVYELTGGVPGVRRSVDAQWASARLTVQASRMIHVATLCHICTDVLHLPLKERIYIGSIYTSFESFLKMFPSESCRRLHRHARREKHM